MAKYTPAFEINDIRKTDKNYFKHFIRYEDNLSFIFDNSKPDIPVDTDNVVDVYEEYIVEELIVDPLYCETGTPVEDSESELYVYELPYDFKENIFLIQCNNNNKSIVFDYEYSDGMIKIYTTENGKLNISVVRYI